jgi:Leucine-rich repeat (LRR) protein
MKNKIYPFKFLDSYTAEDKDIFFGREEEVDQLYQMIYQSDILLLYGASGTGKTSLIQCGLASKFQKHDWLEIFVRRHKNLNESLQKSLIAVGGQKEESREDSSENLDWLNDLMKDDEITTVSTKTLSKTQVFLKNIYLKHFRPIYLIFDQFEELFILGSKEEQAQFITTVQEILKVEQPVKLIFSIREEYLGSLYEFERAVPELFRKKLRIDPMNLSNVKDVVLGATRAKKSIVHINEEEADAIAEKVFEKIRGKEKTLTIQLPYLQVFLDKFYRHISKDKSKNPTTEATFSLSALEEIGDIGDILRDFLDEQIVEISKDQNCERKTIWKILSPFVTIDGTKEPIDIDTLDQNFPNIQKDLIEHVVIALMNNRILRYIEEEELYEIAHDSLALRIAEKRSDDEIALLEVQNLIKSQSLLKDEARELFSEKQLDFVSPFLGRLKLNSDENQLIEESKKKVLQSQKEATRKKILVAILVGLVFIIIFSFAVVSNNERLRAEEANEKNEKIINAMDFYEGKYALAFNNSKYGFIDKDGEPKIDFDYNKGEPFDSETGFAEMEIEGVKVSDPNIKYLIDTSGTRYRLINVSEILQSGTNVKSILSEEDLKWIKSKLKKNKKQKSLLSKLEQIQKGAELRNEELISILNKDQERLALDFSGLTNADILSSLERITKEKSLKGRVELLFFNGTDLDTLPDFISEFKNLQQLDLSWTSVSTLPPSFNQLTHLVKLNLFGAQLSAIPERIGDLKKLKELSISGPIETIPESIFELKNLVKLNLWDAELNAIPERLGEFKKLKELSLSGLAETIPESIFKLKNLIKLDLSTTKLITLSEKIGDLENLESLTVSGLMKTIPESVFKLKNLVELDLSTTELTTVSEKIGDLENLERLSISGVMETIPNSIIRLKNLKRINFWIEELTTIPSEIGVLEKLEDLSIQGSINLIPESIGNLKNLESLTIIGKMKTIPESIVNLGKLKYLDLYSLELVTIPQFPNLDFLMITGSIKVIPESIGNLEDLESLTIIGEMKTIPESIGNLKNLEALELSSKELRAIPNSVFELESLEYLGINNNPKLKNIPDISAFEKLDMFSYTLYENEDYKRNKAKLEALQKELPDCDFYIVDKEGNPIDLLESNE